MGTWGVCPLTIVSTVPDILHHYARCIADAKYDVILGTNFWRGGDAVGIINNALRDLSNRVKARSGENVVVKIIFDRGSINMVNPRQIISEKDYTSSAIGLPALKDIPQVHLEVMNYHNFPVGTFHPKFLVVDRRIALINSNNIQDNSNLEMMAHLEGPIVDSIYDMAIISWGTTLTPALPSLQLVDPTSHLYTSAVPDIESLQAEADEANARIEPKEGETRMDAVTRCLNSTFVVPPVKGTAPSSGDDEHRKFTPYITHESKRVAMTLVNRKAYAPVGRGLLSSPQNEAWLAGFRYAQKEIYIQSPDLNAEPAVKAVFDAVNRGVVVTLCLCFGYNDFGEMLPGQGGVNDEVVKKLYADLPEGKRGHLKTWWYTARDMLEPINATEAVRTCHIKVMIVDRHLAIQGSGNQDTQSWFHSQEINCMIDSPEMCESWLRQLAHNQNSREYGAVQNDGVWRSEDGQELGGRWGGLWKRGKRWMGYEV